jgi:glutamate 5-kinase
MVSKLDAVKLATAAGIPTVIANGRRAGIIPRIAAGERVGTLFPVQLENSDKLASSDKQ